MSYRIFAFLFLVGSFFCSLHVAESADLLNVGTDPSQFVAASDKRKEEAAQAVAAVKEKQRLMDVQAGTLDWELAEDSGLLKDAQVVDLASRISEVQAGMKRLRQEIHGMVDSRRKRFCELLRVTPDAVRAVEEWEKVQEQSAELNRELVRAQVARAKVLDEEGRYGQGIRVSLNVVPAPTDMRLVLTNQDMPHSHISTFHEGPRLNILIPPKLCTSGDIFRVRFSNSIA